MPSQAAELAQRLAQQAEAVCRHYLSNGHRSGRYWVVGDVANRSGRSLFVRLTGPSSGKGAAGKWTDAATLEHGDLLDLIALNRGFTRMSETLDEARSFLSLPRHDRVPEAAAHFRAPPSSADAAQRLFGMARPISGSLAEAYLRKRGITGFHETAALRYHPACYYRPAHGATTEIWPALVAAVTDQDGTITGVHRTWLDPSTIDKAPLDTPRRAMGHLLGNSVRFGLCRDVMAAGEGIETMLSVRSALPWLPVVAALSANHLAALLFPPTLRRLYIVRDNDPAGAAALAALFERAQAAAVEAVALTPQLCDFNQDLQNVGIIAIRAALTRQLGL